MSAAQLGQLLRSSGNELGVPPRAGIAVRLANDEELQGLNARYLGIDGATDVLAFPGGSKEGHDVSRGDAHVGDIAISVERALRQAPDGVAELRLLAVHGLLHCLGLDHDGVENAAAMTEATRRLLPRQAVPPL